MHWVYGYPAMDYLSNDQEDHPNQDENIHNVWNETEYSILSLTESQWKLRQQHDQNFIVEHHWMPLLNK